MAPADPAPPPPMKARGDVAGVRAATGPADGRSSASEPPASESIPGEAAAADPAATESEPPDVASAQGRALRPSAELRREIKAIEADARSGKIGVKETRKRLSALKDDLEAALRDEARGGAGRAETDAKLDEILRRLDAIEARLDRLERR